jgi:hypothetical protein
MLQEGEKGSASSFNSLPGQSSRKETIFLCKEKAVKKTN